MGGQTSIEWTDRSWNPLSGCDKVSPGCDHCYAESIAHRFAGTPQYPDGFAVTLRPERLDQPLRWRKPSRIFVNSMSDLFHDSVPDEYIAKVFAVMAESPRHTFQVLTKRHARMRSLLSSAEWPQLLQGARDDLHSEWDDRWDDSPLPAEFASVLPNVWLGVSAENQQWADIRIPALLDTPAAVRFVSAEPLIGPIKLPAFCACGCNKPVDTARAEARSRSGWLNPDQAEAGVESTLGIDWVIAGGESGRGARPMHPNWARGLRDQCQAAGVAFLFKQRGEWTWNELGEFRMPTQPFTDRAAVIHPAGMTAMTKSNPFNPFERGHPFWATRIDRVGKKAAGRELDGRTWGQYPEAVSV